MNLGFRSLTVTSASDDACLIRKRIRMFVFNSQMLACGTGSLAVDRASPKLASLADFFVRSVPTRRPVHRLANAGHA